LKLRPFRPVFFITYLPVYYFDWKLEHLRKPVEREKYEHRDYTSGKIISKHDQVYGRVEVKAKHPNGRGIWPAIWMMPRDESDATGYGWWPASGEIDIFEGRGQTPTKIQSGKLSHPLIGQSMTCVNFSLPLRFKCQSQTWTST